MANFVRDSRFRHVEVKLDSRDRFYEQLRPASTQIDCSNSVAANSQFLAYVDASGGSSCVGVLPLSSVGKNHVPISAPAYQQPLVRAHSQAVQDVAFDAFDRHTFYTCANDGHLKGWKIPSGGYIVDESNPLFTLNNSRSAAFRSISPHPTASGITATRSTKDIFLFDLTAQREIHASSAGLFTADIGHVAWSYTGHLLMSTSEDKMLRCFDLRTSGRFPLLIFFFTIFHLILLLTHFSVSIFAHI